MSRIRLPLALVVLSAVVPMGAHADDPIDWAMVTVTAGPQGVSDLAFDFDLVYKTAHQVGSDQLAFGYGAAGPAGGIAEVDSAGGGPTRVSTSAGLGGNSIEVTRTHSTYYGGGVQDLFVQDPYGLAPGQQVIALLFGVNVSIEQRSDSPGLYIMQGGDAVSYLITQGTGSRAMTLGQPEDNGNSIAIGSGAAGTSVASATPGDGIVGAFAYHDACVGVCMASWSAPDGSGAPFAASSVPQVAAAGQGSPTFQGPAGPWSWSWSGITTDDPTTVGPTGSAILGAYAPIGDAWKLFAPPSSSNR